MGRRRKVGFGERDRKHPWLPSSVGGLVTDVRVRGRILRVYVLGRDVGAVLCDPGVLTPG